MATISEHIEQLKIDKQTLVDNLVAKGVEATSDETFTSLVPKVNDIQSGADISEYFSPIDTSKSISSMYVGSWIYSIKKLYIPENTVINKTNPLFRGFLGEEIINVEKLKISISAPSSQFMGCTNLKKLDLSNWVFLVKPTNISNMFMNCTNLETVDVSTWDTSKVDDFSQIFNGCSKLETINISNFDFSLLKGTAVSSTNNMFAKCTNLQNLTFGTNLGKGYSNSSNETNSNLILSACTKLSHDSLIDVINKLYDLTLNGVTTKQLVIGATNIAKLTEEEIAIATNKGWIVS